MGYAYPCYNNRCMTPFANEFTVPGALAFWGTNQVIFQKKQVQLTIMEDYPMNTNELFEAIVQRLGTELKELSEQIHSGQLPANAIETVVRQKLWYFRAQACLPLHI
jgi:hypothetical protein